MIKSFLRDRWLNVAVSGHCLPFEFLLCQCFDKQETQKTHMWIPCSTVLSFAELLDSGFGCPLVYQQSHIILLLYTDSVIAFKPHPSWPLDIKQVISNTDETVRETTY